MDDDYMEDAFVQSPRVARPTSLSAARQLFSSEQEQAGHSHRGGPARQERSGGLHLPPGISKDSLRLDSTLRPPASQALPSPSLSESPHLPSSSSSSYITYSDRFIPCRSPSQQINFALLDKLPGGATRRKEEGTAAYSQLLRSELFGSTESVSSAAMSPGVITPEKGGATPGGGRDSLWSSPMSSCSPGKNLFRFKSDLRSSSGSSGGQPESPYSLAPVGPDGVLAGLPTSPKPQARRIARSPYKVLDAPALQDDFYLNLVDWSTHNVLAVALGPCVYLWSAHSSRVTKLCDVGPNDSICSVRWSQRGTYLAVGCNQGETQVWDAESTRRLRTMPGHRSRVGTLAWSAHSLATGSRDRAVLVRDVRAPADYTARLAAHKSEVCGLQWAYDNKELASGGNDNQLLVWNQANHQQPVCRFEAHLAAVKAIAWSPHQHGVLASGGGTADRCIRFWNTATNSSMSYTDTGSQVCNLVWSKNANELVSTHGYSQNQIVVWRYPSMSKLATLTGHTMRVLYLAVSPDGQTIVTGAGDETLRFWNIFPPLKAQSSVRESGAIHSLGRTQIR